MFKITAERSEAILEQWYEEFHEALDRFKELGEAGFKCIIKRMYQSEKAAWIIQ